MFTLDDDSYYSRHRIEYELRRLMVLQLAVRDWPGDSLRVHQGWTGEHVPCDGQVPCGCCGSANTDCSLWLDNGAVTLGDCGCNDCGAC